MHQFAEGEIHEQHAQERQMGKEEGTKVSGRLRRKGNQSHNEYLGLGDINLVKIPHADARSHQTEQKEQREIVIGQRNIADLWIDETSSKQEQQRQNNRNIRYEQPRHTCMMPSKNSIQPRQTGMGSIKKRKWRMKMTRKL